MIIYSFSFTDKGDLLNRKISELLDTRAYLSGIVKGQLKELTKTAFENADAVIFIGAAGIAVRAIAPFVKSKTADPAVIVCDELASFVIPILSGHIGGANDLAQRLAALIGAVPVITTATDINGVWAVDTWAVKKGFKVYNADSIKHISSALLKGKSVGLISDIELTDKLPDNVVFDNTSLESGIVISPFIKKPFKHTLNLIPRCVCLGVGSKKDADKNALCELTQKLLDENRIDPYAVCAIATINIKCNENAVLELCKKYSVPLTCYTAEQLNQIEGNFKTSDFVKSVTGTDNVCERSAVFVSSGWLIINKTAGDGVTLAAAMKGVKKP